MITDDILKLRQQAIEPWEKGAQAGDSMCTEAYNAHLNEDTVETIYEGETDENGLPHGEGLWTMPTVSIAIGLDIA